MKNYLKAIPITTVIIIYLYACDGLYLIAYWSTFNFDISNLVSISDIPKNFVFPFILSNIFFLIQVVAAELTKKPIEEKESVIVIKTYNIKMFIIDTILFSITVLILVSYNDYKYNGIYWGIACLFFLLFLTFKISKLPLVHKYIPSPTLRYYTFTILFTVPTFCIFNAKISSIAVYNNIDIKYTKINSNTNNINTNDTLSFKLLGFLGDKLIVGSLNNKKIVVINQDSFNSVELFQKENSK